MATAQQGVTPAQLAGEYLEKLRNSGADQQWTENVLVFFNRLRDQFQVVQSKSTYVSPRGWGVMPELIQLIEERGVAVLEDPDVNERITGFLSDMASGKIVLKRIVK